MVAIKEELANEKIKTKQNDARKGDGRLFGKVWSVWSSLLRLFLGRLGHDLTKSVHTDQQEQKSGAGITHMSELSLSMGVFTTGRFILGGDKHHSDEKGQQKQGRDVLGASIRSSGQLCHIDSH